MLSPTKLIKLIFAVASLGGPVAFAQEEIAGPVEPGPPVQIIIPDDPTRPEISAEIPPLVSGTCFEIYGLATKAPLPWLLLSARMRINGDIIAAPSVPGTDISGTLRIDTTHYAHLTPLDIRFEATYQNIFNPGDVRIVSSPHRFTQVWNRFFGFFHPESFGGGTDLNAAVSAASSANHVTDTELNLVTDEQFFQRGTDVTNYFVHTHGGNSTTGTGELAVGPHESWADIDNINAVEIALMTANRLNIPPANLAVQVACEVGPPTEPGNLHEFAHAWLLPDDVTRDRAFMGYNGAVGGMPPDTHNVLYTPDAGGNLFVIDFYSRLQQGYQIFEARKQALPYLRQMLEYGGYPENPGHPPDNSDIFFTMPIYGDWKSSLRGVYRDNLSEQASLEWCAWL
ncbi:MAG: hypothetical protein K8R88_11440 [Armatimonadetes bacterium]|nr:hypothetical protein [Armatimonadota bacterium]